MKLTRSLVIIPITVFLGAFVLGGGVAHANKLEVDPDAPAWAHLTADVLLYGHIGSGTICILMGATAIASRKGGTINRATGNIFFVSMFIAYAIGASVATFLDEGQRPNFVGGVLGLYFLITAWFTVKRPDFRAGRSVAVGLVVALAITGRDVLFMRMAAASPTGTVDGSLLEAFFIFTFYGSAAAVGELSALLRHISDRARIARHLWRMCSSLFFTVRSFFLGQRQVFPDCFNATPLPFLFAFAPLIAMIVWLIVVRFVWRDARSGPPTKLIHRFPRALKRVTP